METVAKAGRYEIVGELGRGAMGIVYKAVDPVIGRTVAVKTIRLSEEGTGLKRPELLARFQTEARAAGLLTHPNIVVVYDAGEEDGLYYITMELVEGKSLQALLDGGHSFPLPRTLRILDQTCNALQFAHERNVVHRDIKPANLMLTADDTVKITDFGTAKILQFGSTQQTSHVMGTPSYMSPEQVKGRAVDGRSDIFSLGVMLYEMVTGEKPFPGQNITTVIYKIVNEEPVPPRQIDPSIHPGISAVVMKALAKEPEQRYQTCREMLEDLRNYRAQGVAGGNPNSTMMIGGASPAATIATGNAGGRGLAGYGPADDPTVIATARSLSARTASPGQTPVVRRTGTIAPHVEPAKPPKKKSVVGTIFAAFLLLGVIVYGANKMKPVFVDARALHNSQVKESQSSNTTAAATGTTPDNSAPNSAPADSSQAKNEAADSSTDSSVDPKPVDPAPDKPALKKPDNSLTPKAAEYKGRIEEAISEKGYAGRAKVQGTGNTLTLAGKLRPSEHGELLKFLRNAPASVHVIDHIEYDDAPASAAGGSDDSSHPVPAAGRGAIHVVTDVIGATARLHGPAGKVLSQCETPCSFNNLKPQRYSLEVQKEGYQPLQTALQIKGDEAQDQKLKLEPLAKGIFITTQPPGADVFINGAKQSGQTPVVLPLAPGQYNLVLRLQGYEPYSGSIQVKDIQTPLNVELTQRTNVAWAQVNSNPKGAEIIVDGNSTGQFTPSRVQIPSGLHTITLKLDGYQAARRTVQASEGGTVPVNLTLQQK
ncbi:MAG TPA: serine/threonine-protein kinase [Candidatus Acidoferrum sp.]|nr:serine/threonine-protein kinase [Candidatus Acidoferrum sp.]